MLIRLALGGQLRTEMQRPRLAAQVPRCTDSRDASYDMGENDEPIRGY